MFVRKLYLIELSFYGIIPHENKLDRNNPIRLTLDTNCGKIKGGLFSLSTVCRQQS